MFELKQRFYFEAAHTLNREIQKDSSRRIHGHTYHAEVTLSGELDPTTGMVFDLGHLRKELEVVKSALDHQFLDEVQGIGPATMENLCCFIWNSLEASLPGLKSVALSREASGDSCIYIPDGRRRNSVEDRV